jgi:hypothetical protein
MYFAGAVKLQGTHPLHNVADPGAKEFRRAADALRPPSGQPQGREPRPVNEAPQVASLTLTRVSPA